MEKNHKQITLRIFQYQSDNQTFGEVFLFVLLQQRAPSSEEALAIQLRVTKLNDVQIAPRCIYKLM